MTTKKAFGVILLLTIVGLIYNYKHLGSYPSHIHAWVQADRYALAVGFKENNLNFFKPQTYIYNHQFPGEWKTAGPSRITAVDFPIHDFIPAVIMKLTGSQSPLIFRLYIFIYSLIGLFFLFKLAYAITQCFYRSLFISLAAASSPVFVYYQAGFLPTVPSVANLLIGLYFYFQYLKLSDSKNFYLSVLFATLAALTGSLHQSKRKVGSNCIQGSVVDKTIYIYRTKNDYSRNVCVELSADKSKITGFPAPNTRTNWPIKLADGYLLNGTSGVNSGFISLFIDDYTKPLGADSLYKLLIDKDPFIEFYKGLDGNRGLDTAEINRIILNNELGKFFIKLK